MKKIMTLIFALYSILLSASYKFPLVHGNQAFTKKGDIYDNGYPEAKYHEVLSIFKRVYGEIIKKEGGTFHIMDDWGDGAVNMWAWRTGAEYWLEIPGGMSRYHLINEEAFVTSICHELGHLLGGEPTQGIGRISLEGQSDYYATFYCIEKMLTEIKPLKTLKASQDVTTLCKNVQDKRICYRALEGSLSLTSYYAFLEKSPFPKYSTPSERRVSQTLRSHPKAQCRLDTFKAGFFKLERPGCWYKP